MNTNWGTTYRNCNYWTTGTNDYNLWGHNATYYNSQYLTMSESELEYLIIKYTDGTLNLNKTAKVTTVSHILF